MLFAALHMSAYGTKRTYRDNLLFVRFRRKADMARPPMVYRSGAKDPKRTSLHVPPLTTKEPKGYAPAKTIVHGLLVLIT